MKKFLSQILTITILFFSASIASVNGQENRFEVSGIVYQNSIPVNGALVFLNQKSNAAVTNEKGEYKFTNLIKGNYTISIKLTGENPVNKAVLVDKDITAFNFDIKVNAQNLNEVIVISKKSVNESPVSVGKSGIKSFDLPQSVSIVGQELIADQQVNKLSDIIQNVNGVALGTARGGTSESFFARGYSLGSRSMLKNGTGVSSAVIPEASTLESVEILKGSAAMLYGNVSSGAVINLVTKKPKFEYGGEVSLRAASYDMYKPIVDLYGPISKKLAFRVVGTYENAGSFRNNVTSDRVYVNPSLLYKVGDKTDLLFEADFLKYDNTPDFGIGTLDGQIPTTIGRDAFFNTPWAYNKVNQTTSAVTLNHKLNNSWTFNSVLGYQNYDRDYFSTERIQAKKDGEWTRGIARANSYEDFYNGQLNFNGKINTGKITHQVLIGADADSYITNTNGYKPLGSYDTINILNPNNANMRTDVPTAILDSVVKAPTYRYGLYAQDLIALSDKFKVLAGLRFSAQRIADRAVTYVATGLKNNNISNTKNDRAFSPKLGFVYQPTKNTSFFASYANSFEVNTGTDVFFNNLEPSIIDQYEIGLKKDFFQNRFSANFSVYKIINNNTTQVAEFQANGDINSNSQLKEFLGQTTSDGFEIDLSGKIIGQLNFMAGYSYIFMRFTKVPGTKNSPIEGEQFVRNVPHTANGTLFYTLNKGKVKGLKLGASAFYTGNRFAGWNNKVGQSQTVSRIIPVAGFTTMDLSAGYSFKTIAVLAKVSNITNELNYIIHENYSVNPINPRMISTTLTYKF